MSRVISIQVIVISCMISLIVVVLIGTSFAYYVGTTTVTNKTNFTVKLPEAYDKSSRIEVTSCNMNVTYEKMSNTYASNTTPMFNTNCYLNVIVNGAPDDYCQYNIALSPKGNAYHKPSGLTLTSGTYEFSAEIKRNGADFVSQGQIDTIASGDALNSTQTTTVETGAKSKVDSYQLMLRFYNLNTNQTGLLTDSIQNYTYELKLLDINCNFNN